MLSRHLVHGGRVEVGRDVPDFLERDLRSRPDVLSVKVWRPADSSPLEASIAEHKRVIWVATFVVFAALWALLVLLVRGASRTLRRQTDALRERSSALLESYRRLEQSSLEAIETLNATVEAKDPGRVPAHRAAGAPRYGGLRRPRLGQAIHRAWSSRSLRTWSASGPRPAPGTSRMAGRLWTAG